MLKMPIAEFAKDKEKDRDIVMIVDEEILNECAEPPADGVVSPTSRSKIAR